MANLRKIEAEEQFKKTQKQDKKFLGAKEKAKQVEREKIARQKALRLAKEATSKSRRSEVE